MLLHLLVKEPLVFLLIAIPLLYSLIMHELAHAACAAWFGDTTARDRGRVTLNPLAHLDPIGTLLLMTAGFGWAKPVPINYANVKPRRAGIICCSLAGVTTNFLIAFACLFFYKLVRPYVAGESFILLSLGITAEINIIIASFNLIPIPPLDGSRVLAEMLPRSIQFVMFSIEKVGIIILIILLNMRVLDPLIDFIRSFLLTIIGMLI